MLDTLHDRSLEMATSSGGVEWSHLVKPIINVLYSSINKQEIPEVVKAILKRYVLITDYNIPLLSVSLDVILLMF